VVIVLNANTLGSWHSSLVIIKVGETFELKQSVLTICSTYIVLNSFLIVFVENILTVR
jgi:hypothetical protein